MDPTPKTKGGTKPDGPDPKDQGWNQTVPVVHDGSDLFGSLRIDKVIVKGNTYVGVGTMKDKKLKLMDLRVSDTLGCVGNWNT